MDPKDVPAWISAVASVLSAGGVFLAFGQLWLSRRIAQSQFEDALAREYRDLACRLPARALLGGKLSEEAYEAAFDELFRYIDLSNEQVFLRQQRRVSERVWRNWCAGIRSNLARPAFARAWREITTACDSFQELRRLEREGFATDPARWSAEAEPTAAPDPAGT